MSKSNEHRRWYHIKWFQDYDTPDERKLIVKLDLLIVPYVFVVGLSPFLTISFVINTCKAYWTKYIDQANISVSIDLVMHAVSNSSR